MYNSYDFSTYSSTYPSTYADSQALATGIGAAFGAFMGILLIIGIAIAVIQIVAMWKMFTKAGEKGWKSIIPFYNIAILYKISGLSPWLVLIYVAAFIPIINFIAAIALVVINLYQKINLAKGFNKSTGFTVGLILVPFVFYLILGFGKSEYVGFPEEVTSSEE